jgi:ATP-dependent Clp protease ATP-binding subunit ClpC
MFVKLTDRANAILSIAQDQASLCGEVLARERHVLLAILSHGHSLPAAILLQQGVDYHQSLSFFQLLPSKRSERHVAKIADDAFEEATRLGHLYGGPEHLLITLLRPRKGVVRTFLKTTGFKPAALHKMVLETMGFNAKGQRLRQ